MGSTGLDGWMHFCHIPHLVGGLPLFWRGECCRGGLFCRCSPSRRHQQWFVCLLGLPSVKERVSRWPSWQSLADGGDDPMQASFCAWLLSPDNLVELLSRFIHQVSEVSCAANGMFSSYDWLLCNNINIPVSTRFLLLLMWLAATYSCCSAEAVGFT